jgi:dihydroorotase
VNPRKIFGLPGGALEEGQPADLTVLDLNRPHSIDSGSFRSLGRATPFDGWMVSAAAAMTICGGEIVYHDLRTQEDV